MHPYIKYISFFFSPRKYKQGQNVYFILENKSKESVKRL